MKVLRYILLFTVFIMMKCLIIALTQNILLNVEVVEEEEEEEVKVEEEKVDQYNYELCYTSIITNIHIKQLQHNSDYCFLSQTYT